jgi:hypothetical protein
MILFFSSCQDQVFEQSNANLPNFLSETPIIGVNGDYILSPQTFERTVNEPTLYEIELSMDPCMCFTAPYYLTVVNGDAYGDNLVSNAIIIVDEVIVFEQSDFKKKVETLNQEIDIQDQSILKIEVRGKPGSSITVSVEGTVENCKWNQTYGGSSNDQGYSIIETQDDGYIFTGRSYSNDGDVSGGPGTWVVKLDYNGNLEWEKSFSDLKGYYNIKQSVQDGYILSSNVGVMQLDLTGNLIWNRIAPNNAIIQRSDLNYIMVYGLNRQILILNNDGTLSSSKPLPSFYGICLFEDHTSNLETVIGGLNYNNSASGWFGAVKVDPVGAVIWQKDYNNSTEIPIAITQDKNGDFVLVGTDFQAVKFGPDGAMKWMKYIVPDNYTFDAGGIANSVISSSNGYLIAGHLKNDLGSETGDTQYYDGWVAEIDENGNILRSKFFGGQHEDRVFGVCEPSPGFAVVGGHSKSFNIDGESDFKYWAEKICFD